MRTTCHTMSERELLLTWWMLALVLIDHPDHSFASSDNSGPVFTIEPPNQVDFSNSTGTRVDCTAVGRPPPTVRWIHSNGVPVAEVRGLQKPLSNGSLVFSPFRADDYRQDIHAAIYRCVVSSSIGLVVSRDVRVRAVVMQRYEVQVYSEFVIQGNTAVFKCHIPSFVTDYVKVTSWIRDTDFNRHVHIQNDERHMIMPTGELHIRDVGPADAEQSYRCKTRHQLTGETRTSSTAGRLIITNPQGSVSPRITDSRSSVHVREGETAVLPCAAHGHPSLTYSWFFKSNRSQSERVTPGDRRKLVGGTLVVTAARRLDMGVYSCVVSNNLGNQTAETVLSVTMPLAVYIQPREQVVSLGKAATFLCTVTGYPVSSTVWYKDGSPMVDVSGRVQSGDILRLHSVQKSNKGMYQCVAKNERESVQGTAELRLGDAVPELTESFLEKTVQPGSFVSLRCSASGNPPPKVVWLQDGEPLPERFGLSSGQYTSVHDDVVAHLNVSGARVDDSGDYTCLVRNRLGQDGHTARVNVYGPVGIRRMRNLTVVAGDNMVVKCRVTGYPIESISWEKDGMPLPVNVKQRVYPNGTLVVHEVSRESDGGRYVCTARAAHMPSGVSREVDVVVLVPPRIIPFSFQDEDLYEGMRAQITCAVRQGDLPITIKWLKDERSIGADGVATRLFDSYTSSLSIDSVTSAHNGNYTCVASNAAAASNFTAQLHVNVPPRWIVEPTDTTVVVGSDVVLNCQAQGFPQPIITWMKAVGDVPQEYREVAVGNVHLRHLQNGSLHIRGAREFEQGFYLCQASNGIGGGLSKVFFVDVQVPVRFSVRHSNVTSRRGEVARLVCEAFGDPPISITWKKNGLSSDVVVGNRFEVKESLVRNGLMSVLEVRHVERTDTAVFTCDGHNAFGRDSALVKFTVKEAPEPPRGIAVRDYGSRSVEITWIEGNDGNSAISRYVVQFRPAAEDEIEGEFVNVTIPGTSPGSTTVTGLIPFTKYVIRMIAENDVGVSAVSDTVSITTAEEAPGGAPRDIVVEVPEPQALKILWKPPKPELWFGDILGYNVGYRVHGSGDSYLFRTVEVGDDGSGKVILRSLKTFTHYDVVIQAYNRHGPGPQSEVVTAVTLEDVPRVSPLDVQCVPLSSQSIHVTWQSIPSEAINGILLGYKITYRLVDHDESEEGSMVTSSLETVLHGLEKFQNYSIGLLGYTRVGDGVVSKPIVCRTQEDVPDAPSNIKAVVTSLDTITLSWQPSPRPNGIIVKYTVYARSVEDGKDNTTKYVLPLSKRQFVVSNLRRGQSYEFWVTASTSIGEGQSTRMVSQTPDYKVPATIISFGGPVFGTWKSKVELPCQVAGDPFPIVSWKFDGHKLEFSPRIFQRRDGDLVIQDVQPSDSGEYACNARNNLGSDAIVHTLVIQAPPGPPSLTVGSVSFTSMILKWKSSLDRSNEIQHYTIFFKREYGDWESVQVKTDVGTHVFDRLYCGTKYQVYVVASNRLGPGEPSEVLAVRTRGSAPGRPPKEKLLQSFSKHLTLNLNAWDDGGCEILYFIVEYRQHSSDTWILVSNNIKPQRELFMLPDLRTDAIYHLRITAHNSAGSTVAAYEFSLTNGSRASLSNDRGSSLSEVPFYLDFKLILSVSIAVCGLVIIIVVYAVCMSLQRKKMSRHHLNQYSVSDKDINAEFLHESGGQKNDFRNLDSSNRGFTYLAGNVHSCQNHPSDCRKNYEDDISPYATYRIPDGSKPVHPSAWHELPLKASSALALYPDVKIEDSSLMSEDKDVCLPPRHLGSGHIPHEPNVPDLLYHGTESSASNEDLSPEIGWSTMDRADPSCLLVMPNGSTVVNRCLPQNFIESPTHFIFQSHLPTAPSLDDEPKHGRSLILRESGQGVTYGNERCNEHMRRPDDCITSRSYIGDF